MKLSFQLNQLMGRLCGSSEPKQTAPTDITSRLMAIKPKTGLNQPRHDLSTIIEQSRDIRRPGDASTTPLVGLSQTQATAPRIDEQSVPYDAKTLSSLTTEVQTSQTESPHSKPIRSMKRKELSQEIKSLRAKAKLAERDAKADYQANAGSTFSVSGRVGMNNQIAQIKAQLKRDIQELKANTKVV